MEDATIKDIYLYFTHAMQNETIKDIYLYLTHAILKMQPLMISNSILYTLYAR